MFFLRVAREILAIDNNSRHETRKVLMGLCSLILTVFARL
jgi:hypothetical protein